MSIYNHTAVDRTPYTYLIGWSQLDTWYYGVQFGTGCHPDKLFFEEKRSKQSYNTSSRYVDRFVKEHGQPDIVQIRHIFETPKAALNWESTVIRRMGMVKSSRFLNKRDPRGKFHTSGPLSEETKLKLRKPKKPRIISDEEHQQRSAAAKELNARPEVIKKHKETQNNQEWKERHSEIMKEICNRPDIREKNRQIQLIVQNLPEVKEKRKETISTPEWKERQSEIMKEVQNRPEVNAKRSKSLIEANKNQDSKDRRSKAAKEAQNRPDVKEKRKEVNSNPIVKERRCAAQKEAQNRPETNAKRSESRRRFYARRKEEQTPDLISREKRSIAQKEAQNRPETREKRAASLKAAWARRKAEKLLKEKNIEEFFTD